MTATARRALADATHRPYWLDRPERPDPLPPLTGPDTADLAVIGGGYHGLWTALLAKHADPGRDVVLLEAGTCGWAASGRNGGFCAASLTHGSAAGNALFPAEIDTLEQLGRANLDAIEDTITRYGIDCDFRRSGELVVATEPHQLATIAATADLARRFDQHGTLLDRDAIRAEVDSPTYLGGFWDRDGVAMLDPARLAWGLRRTCLALGVRIHEHTRVTGLHRDRAALRLRTTHGQLRADRVALATNGFPPLLRRLRRYVVPVYDYALMTEPLTAGQLTAVGWRNRQGISDAAHQFHYYRITADNRILYGGYDAIYHYGGRMTPALERRTATFDTLARHFQTTFPQLADVRFSHTWGGVIDTCSRLFAFHGTAYDGWLAYAAGFTGLGVGATRFAARVTLDLLAGADTALTRLALVRDRPVPFPPEPLRAAVINLTRRSMARADANAGRHDRWLRTLDRLGLGFDT